MTWRPPIHTEAVQSLDMHARELVRGHFIDSVDVHALAQKPGRGQKNRPGWWMNR